MAAYALEIVLIIVVIYGIAYMFYGRKLLQTKVVKADAGRPTPAVEKFDGIDYVPANKYVLYGHHFASIAGAGPIVGPAIAMAYGWFLPLVWVLFGNVFIGAVHDYLSLMASVRYGGISIMSVSENVMGRRARFIFLLYVYFALILVLAAFLSVAATVYTKAPGAATKAIIYMPLALLLGFLIYRVGLGVRPSTVLVIIFVILGFYYAYKIPLIIGFDPSVHKVGSDIFWATYHKWVIILALYSLVAASLPVWYLLQPRDYLNAYLLWFFVFLAGIGAFLIADVKLTAPAYTEFAPPIFKGRPTYFWPAIPLIIACGSLSGFHSVVASGTSSKQLSSELDALLVGYGGMLTEGAVATLAVILPISLAWSAPELINMGVIPEGKNILALDKVGRFAVGYAYMSAKALDRLGISFEQAFPVVKLFALIALATFILTTLDTATRLSRFAWQELLEPIREKSPGFYNVIANRWVASGIAVLAGAAMAYPTVMIGGKPAAAYNIIWPAFAGTNQLLAALALLTSALWVYAILKVRGGTSALIIVPALFLWFTVTVALIWWTIDILPQYERIQQIGAGSIVIISIILDFLLIALFLRGLFGAQTQTRQATT